MENVAASTRELNVGHGQIIQQNGESTIQTCSDPLGILAIPGLQIKC